MKLIPYKYCYIDQLETEFDRDELEEIMLVHEFGKNMDGEPCFFVCEAEEEKKSIDKVWFNKMIKELKKYKIDFVILD